MDWKLVPVFRWDFRVFLVKSSILRLRCLVAIGKRLVPLMERRPQDERTNRWSKAEICRDRTQSDQGGQSSSLVERVMSWKDSAFFLVENLRKQFESFRRTKSNSSDESEQLAKVRGLLSVAQEDGDVFELKSDDAETTEEKSSRTQLMSESTLMQIHDGSEQCSSSTTLSFPSNACSDSTEVPDADHTTFLGYERADENSKSCNHTRNNGRHFDSQKVETNSHCTRPPFCSSCIGAGLVANEPLFGSAEETVLTNRSDEITKKSLVVVNNQPFRSLSSPAIIACNWYKDSAISEKGRLKHTFIKTLSSSSLDISADIEESSTLLENTGSNQVGSGADVIGDVATRHGSIDSAGRNISTRAKVKEVDVWALRNSMEKARIAIMSKAFPSSENCLNLEHRDSPAADITESPRSSSSSEDVISRGKWTTDSDDERKSVLDNMVYFRRCL